MANTRNTKEQWAAFLNPEIVRSKLISAGLFLVAYEMLLDSIKRHPLHFFTDRWTINGPVPGEKYKIEILARDPKGKNDALRGSIAWLQIMKVITVDDETAFHTVTDARNEIAHEMTAMVSGSKPPAFANHFDALMALLDKIEKWWIINVEIAVNPDFDGREIDEEGIVSGPSWIMHMHAQTALGEGDEAWDLHRQFNNL